MSGGTITIDASERRTLHRLIADRLSRADLVYLHLANDRPAEAESQAIELAQDLALMGEIGWNPEDSRETFELELAPADLLEALERYVEEAERSIFRVGVTYGLDNADAASAARSAQTCRYLISVLDPRSPMLTVTAEERDELHWLLSCSLFRRDPAEASVMSFGQDVRLRSASVGLIVTSCAAWAGPKGNSSTTSWPCRPRSWKGRWSASPPWHAPGRRRRSPSGRASRWRSAVGASPPRLSSAGSFSPSWKIK